MGRETVSEVAVGAGVGVGSGVGCAVGVSRGVDPAPEERVGVKVGAGVSLGASGSVGVRVGAGVGASPWQARDRSGTSTNQGRLFLRWNLILTAVSLSFLGTGIGPIEGQGTSETIAGGVPHSQTATSHT